MKQLQIISIYSSIDDVDGQDQANILYREINIDLVWKVAFQPNCPVNNVFKQNICFHSTLIVEFSRQTSTSVKIPDTWMRLVRFPDFQLPSASVLGSFFLYQFCSSNTSLRQKKLLYTSFVFVAIFCESFRCTRLASWWCLVQLWGVLSWKLAGPLIFAQAGACLGFAIALLDGKEEPGSFVACTDKPGKWNGGEKMKTSE